MSLYPKNAYGLWDGTKWAKYPDNRLIVEADKCLLLAYIEGAQTYDRRPMCEVYQVLPIGTDGKPQTEEDIKKNTESILRMQQAFMQSSSYPLI